MTHPHRSKMKWRIQMLENLNRTMILLPCNHKTYIFFLKKILEYYPPETFSSTIFIKEHPFKHRFEQFGLIPIDEIELPLQKEVISILDELQNCIDNYSTTLILFHLLKMTDSINVLPRYLI